MNRTDRKRRDRLGRCRPRGERLEARLALSTLGDSLLGPNPFDPGLDSPDLLGGGTGLDLSSNASTGELSPFLTAVGTDPAPGMELTQGPTTVSVAFDRPIDPFSLGFNDVYLEQVAPDGSTTRLDLSTGVTADLDASRTRLVLTLPSTLGMGTYRIVLSGASALSGDDFSMLNSDGSDRVLSAFAVVKPGVRLADAIDLGTLGPNLGAVVGQLDLAADPSAVALYRFTLPAGGDWRLGAEVDAQRNGSPLDAALTLFDPNGQVLSTADFGRPDFPLDPYLFAGLKPGTYYLGVSSTGNLPGQPGGYDPANGIAGNPASKAGGAFTLQFVADPISRPTQVLDFGLDRANSQDPTPTGFHLQFSGSLQLPSQGSELENLVSHGLEVVDDLGRSWPIAAVRYDESQARLSLLFLDRLPAGHYTVRLPANAGLTDLAGRAPRAPGQPQDVLGQFTVGNRPSHTANDLGTIFPSATLTGLSREVDLTPGESISYRFVNLYDALYSLQVDLNGGSLTVSYLDPKTGAITSSFHLEDSRYLPVSLKVGDQVLRFSADGATPVHLSWKLSSNGNSLEHLLQNGVGQGPALGLRLIVPSGPTAVSMPSPTEGGLPSPSPNPAPPSSMPGPSPGTTSPTPSVPTSGTSVGKTGSSPSGSSTGANSPLEASSTPSPSFTASVPKGPAGLFLAFGGQPVGRPVPGADSVRTVGPEFGPGAVALAANLAFSPGQSIDPAPISPGSSPTVSKRRRSSPSLEGRASQASPISRPPRVCELTALSCPETPCPRSHPCRRRSPIPA